MTEAKKRPPAIHAGVRRLVDALLAQPKYDLQSAAVAAGMTTYRAREYLMKPHVLRFLRDQKHALLEEICAGNPVALAEIRASSGNDMARVGAVKALEQLKDGVVEETGGGQLLRPGLQIVIVQPSGEQHLVCGPAAPVLPAPAPMRGNADWID